MSNRNNNRNASAQSRGQRVSGGLAGLAAVCGLPESQSQEFLNPYNFVPHGSGCQRSKYLRGTLTGSIHCTLVPMTDFFIPNAAYAVENSHSHKHMDFFSYSAPQFGNPKEYSNAAPPEAPVIPGSELRGMIRSMYEAFTDSCFSIVDDENERTKLTARVPNIRKPGMLKYENGQWSLYEAVSYPISKTQGQFEIGSGFIKFNKNKVEFSIHEPLEEKFSINEPLAFTTSPINKRERVTELRCPRPSDTAVGFLKIGESFGREGRHAHIFQISGNTPLLCGSRLTDAINQFNSLITDFYRNPKVNRLTNGGTPFFGQEIPQTAEEGDCRPIWYRYDKGTDRYYFSPACIGREMFYSHLGDILGTYSPCAHRDNLCEACALFGMVGNKPGASLGSRVRFGDAHFTGRSPVYAPQTPLKILGGPKLTSMAMYTKLKGNGIGRFWTYDSEGVSLNGRKFYYHHKSDYRTQEASRLNVTVRPMKACSGNAFEFDVFFEQISDAQLKKLLFVLSLFGNGSDHFYKLGLGKPLGMGSVKVTVDRVMLRSIYANTLEYSYCETNAYDEFFTGKYDPNYAGKLFSNTPLATLRQLYGMTDFNYAQAGLEVHYPLPQNGNKVFDWFKNNIGSIGNPMFRQLLYPDGKLQRN